MKIFGVDVNVKFFKEAHDSLESLKQEAGQIFAHLEDDAEAAYKELWEAIKPADVEIVEKPKKTKATTIPATAANVASATGNTDTPPVNPANTAGAGAAVNKE